MWSKLIVFIPPVLNQHFLPCVHLWCLLIAKSILQNGCYEADSTTPRPNGPVDLLVYALELRRAREARHCLSVTHDTLVRDSMNSYHPSVPVPEVLPNASNSNKIFSKSYSRLCLAQRRLYNPLLALNLS